MAVKFISNQVETALYTVIIRNITFRIFTTKISRYTVTLLPLFVCQEPFSQRFSSLKSCFLQVNTCNVYHSFHITKLTKVARLCNKHHYPFCDFCTSIIFSGSFVPYFVHSYSLFSPFDGRYELINA
jgi:hypothetical protein